MKIYLTESIINQSIRKEFLSSIKKFTYFPDNGVEIFVNCKIAQKECK